MSMSVRRALVEVDAKNIRTDELKGYMYSFDPPEFYSSDDALLESIREELEGWTVEQIMVDEDNRWHLFLIPA